MQWPTSKNEINWGTVIGVAIAILPMAVGFIVWIVTVSNSVEENSRAFATYQSVHAELHKEAKAGNAAQFADLNARLIAQEGLNAQYRLVALEASMKAFENSIIKLNTDLTDTRTEIRLMSQQMGQIIEYIRGGAIPPRSTTP